MMTPEEIPFAAATACLWEATARKMGNVHPEAVFADCEFSHFAVSAIALGEAFSNNQSVGDMVLATIQKTKTVVKTNTNLGMALLLAPLAVAARLGPIQDTLPNVLAQLTADDTRKVYEAIRLANPGGLGNAPQADVRGAPTVTLQEAMAMAADRDLVARQYANGFQDVLAVGVPLLDRAMSGFQQVEAAILFLQLAYLSMQPDTLITRKVGSVLAQEVNTRAIATVAQGGIATAQGRAACRALDKFMRSDGNKLNPGATADLIAACLFVALVNHTLTPNDKFRWTVEDWL